MAKRKRGETKLGNYSKKLHINLDGDNVKPIPKNEGDKGELCPTCGIVVYPTMCNDPFTCDNNKEQSNLVWSITLTVAGISLIICFL